jgi:hypothetical protein
MRTISEETSLSFQNLFLIFILVAGVTGGSVVHALALHEVNHRYTISGYVYDDHGKPLSNTTVVIKETSGKVLESVQTGSNGAYQAVLHIHNDNLGIQLIVAARNDEKALTVDFDPYDNSSEREVEVNFGNVEETPGISHMGIIIGVLSFALFVIGAYVIFSGKEKKGKKITREKKGKGKKKRR